MKKIFFIISLVVLASCVKDNHYKDIDLQEITSRNKEKAESFTGSEISFSALRAKISEDISLYTDNDAFVGYVISSDEGGNYYKKIYVQGLDNQGTIAISVEKKGLFGDYPIGSKIQVRLKETTIWYNSRYSLIEVGYGKGKTAGGNTRIENLPTSMVGDVLVLTGETFDLQDISAEFENIRTLNKANFTNKLITLKNVSFEESAYGKPFHNPNNQYNTTYNLVDTQGGKVAFLTSSFANFATEIIPNKKVTATGILTKYGSTYQFTISSLSDLQVLD